MVDVHCEVAFLIALVVGVGRLCCLVSNFSPRTDTSSNEDKQRIAYSERWKPRKRRSSCEHLSNDVDCTIWPVMQCKFRNEALVCGTRNRMLEVSSRSMRSDVKREGMGKWIRNKDRNGQSVKWRWENGKRLLKKRIVTSVFAPGEVADKPMECARWAFLVWCTHAARFRVEILVGSGRPASCSVVRETPKLRRWKTTGGFSIDHQASFLGNEA